MKSRKGSAYSSSNLISRGQIASVDPESSAAQQAEQLAGRMVVVDRAWAQTMDMADSFITRRELADLPAYCMEPLHKSMENIGVMRLFILKRLSFDLKEGIAEKLTNVYSAMHSMQAAVFSIIHGNPTGDTLFLVGCRCANNAESAGQMLKNSLEGNFPGIVLEQVSDCDNVLDYILPLEYARKHIVSLSVEVGERRSQPSRERREVSSQSIEKFIDTMKGQEYTALFLAEPITQGDAMEKRRTYEDMITQISKFAKVSLSYNEGNSVSVNESFSHGFSQSISKGISHSTSKSTSSSIGRSSSSGSSYSASVSGTTWLGQSATFSSSSSETSATSVTNSVTQGSSNSINVSRQEGENINITVGMSASSNTGSTMTVNLENKRIANLLAKLEHELKKMEGSTSFGLWDAAVYVLSENESTAMIGASGVRAFLMGEESGKGESYVNHWGNDPKSFQRGQSGQFMRFLHYGRHPVFRRSLLPGKTPQSDCNSPLYDPKSPLYNPIYDLKSRMYDARVDPDSPSYEATRDPASSFYAYDRFMDPTSPDYIRECDPNSTFYDPMRIPPLDPDRYYFTPAVSIRGDALSTFIGLPQKSVPGITVVEMAEFGRNIVTDDPGSPGNRKIRLGEVIYMGKKDRTPVELYVNSLTGHTFVCGAPGSGKSNSVYQILYGLSELNNTLVRDQDGNGNSYGKVNFLIIEPAKGEYKYEFGGMPGINIFTARENEAQMLRVNPFEFPYEHMGIMEHIERLKNIVIACWALTAAMPAILADALETAYLDAGWDLQNSMYVLPGRIKFPSFHNVLNVLPGIIEKSGYSGETKGDYIGALVTRVASLTKGIAGKIFTDVGTVDDKILFDENTVVDLSSVGSTESRSLIMGVLVMKLENYRRSTATTANYPLRHVTVMEEAHNLLPRVSTSQSNETANVQGKSVEIISGAIAEMRTYGEGFIIVDQSPHQVAEIAVSNTSTKIIMRLPGEKDMKTAGASVGLKEEQNRQISMLPQGQAIVKQGNWITPVISLVDRAPSRYHVDHMPLFEYDTLKEFRTFLLSQMHTYIIRNCDRPKIPTGERNRVVSQIEKERYISQHKKDYYKNIWINFCELGENERYEQEPKLVMDVLAFYDGLRICKPRIYNPLEDELDPPSGEFAEVLEDWHFRLLEMLSRYMTWDPNSEEDEELMKNILTQIYRYCTKIYDPSQGSEVSEGDLISEYIYEYALTMVDLIDD